MAKRLSPEQGNVYTGLDGSTQVEDTFGPCMGYVATLPDGSYTYAHFDSSQIKEVEDWLNEIFQNGGITVRIGECYGSINGSLENLALTGSKVNPRSRFRK